MRKWTAIGVSIMMAACLLAGCGGKESAETKAPETKAAETEAPAAQDDGETKAEAASEKKDIKDMTFAYVTSSTNDYWTQLQAGLDDAVEEYGLDMMTTVTKENDIPAAVAAVDAAIGQGVDGIICCCGDPAAFKEVLDTAVSKGIMVVAVDQDSPDSSRQYFVGTSNYDSGYMMGEYFLDKVGDTEQKVAIFAGTITASNAVERMAGFKDAIDGHDNIEIITYEQVNNDVQYTMDKTYALFNAYPEVTAIYGVFAYDPLGAAKVCKELGRDDVFVLGYDDLDDSIQLMKEGWIQGLAVQQPYEIGRVSVETLVSAVQGNGPEEGAIGTDIKIVTPDTVNDEY